MRLAEHDPDYTPETPATGVSIKSKAKAALAKPKVPPTKRRINGFQYPFNGLQFVAIFANVLFSFSIYGSLLLVLQPGIAAFFGVLYTIPFLCHIFFYVIATAIDPADVNVLRVDRNKILPMFDRGKYKHVIENLICNICDCKVTDKAKHCIECNKCIMSFDHHCPWLNNCVGERNYRWFILTLVTAIIGILVVFSLSIVTIAVSLSPNPEGLLVDFEPVVSSAPNSTTTTMSSSMLERPDMTLFFFKVPYVAWLAVTAAILLLSVITLLLAGHLLLFHIFLSCRGLSTYEYIVRKRINVDRLTSRNTKAPSETEERSLFTTRSRFSEAGVATLNTPALTLRHSGSILTPKSSGGLPSRRLSGRMTRREADQEGVAYPALQMSYPVANPPPPMYGGAQKLASSFEHDGLPKSFLHSMVPPILTVTSTDSMYHLPPIKTRPAPPLKDFSDSAQELKALPRVPHSLTGSAGTSIWGSASFSGSHMLSASQERNRLLQSIESNLSDYSITSALQIAPHNASIPGLQLGEMD